MNENQVVAIMMQPTVPPIDDPKSRTIKRFSALTGNRGEMTIFLTDAQYAEILEFIKDRSKARYIQDILPDHPADEREFILSGVTPAE